MNNELCNYLFVPAERVNVVQTLLLSLECTTRQLVLFPMCKHRHTLIPADFCVICECIKPCLSVIRVRIMSWCGLGWRALVTGLPRWCRGRATRWTFGSLVTSIKGEPQVIIWTWTIFDLKGESWDFRSSFYTKWDYLLWDSLLIDYSWVIYQIFTTYSRWFCWEWSCYKINQHCSKATWIS